MFLGHEISQWVEQSQSGSSGDTNFPAVPFFITDINKRQNVNKSPSLIKYDIIKIYGKPKQCHGQPNEEKNSEHVKNRGRIIHSSYRIN